MTSVVAVVVVVRDVEVTACVKQCHYIGVHERWARITKMGRRYSLLLHTHLYKSLLMIVRRHYFVFFNVLLKKTTTDSPPTSHQRNHKVSHQCIHFDAESDNADEAEEEEEDECRCSDQTRTNVHAAKMQSERGVVQSPGNRQTCQGCL